MAATKGKAGGKPEKETTFDGGPAITETGGADPTPMVGFAALVRVSGPGYVVEEGKTELIPTEYAKAHAEAGNGEVIGKVVE